MKPARTYVTTTDWPILSHTRTPPLDVRRALLSRKKPHSTPTPRHTGLSTAVKARLLFKVTEAEAKERVVQSAFINALKPVHREFSCVVGTGEDGTDEEGLVVLRTQGLDEAKLNPTKLEQLLRLLTGTFRDSVESTTGVCLRGGARELDG